MAGSYASIESDVPPFLHAHLEGLKFLANHLDEPILILNPRMELVYANPAGDKVAKEHFFIPSHAISSSCVRIFKQNHCAPCPVPALFEADGHAHDMASSPVSSVALPASCPLTQVVPLRSKTGMTHFAVLMGARGCDRIVAAQPVHAFPGLSDQQESSVRKSPQRPVIGKSEPIQQLGEMIQLVAASEATVLIQGESGTGKELVAKAIHELSRRRDYPFVVVECSSLPEALLESELFGHVRGAFTGAVNARKGLFEEAEGGTIFLDEIADTTPAFQARLLRVLQEREIKPVGSNQSISVNVRVISAGNKPLEELVKTKHFRADLYYRLAVLPLMVPPLRERKEDIPLLTEYFLDRSTRQHGRLSLTMHPDAQKALSRYAWPGNVRELENLVERAVVTCRHSTIRTSDLFGKQSSHGMKGDLHVVSKAARQEAERDHILQALSETQGDKTRAARLLKISRSNLYNKLRLYHIQ